MPVHRLRRLGALLTALVLVGAGLARLAPRPTPAAAAVSHQHGYRATVDGFSSWYGSYHLDGIGTAWCIDHGIRAPDAALGYVPTDLPGVATDLRTALAWAVGRHGPGADRVTSAALMLVAHDLMGATYPSGDLDVDALPLSRLAGFEGAEAAVLEQARALKADALAHAHLRAGWVLELGADTPAPGATGTLTVRLLAGGVPAAGIDLRASAAGARVGGPDREGPAWPLVTGADGTAQVAFVPGGGPYELRVEAELPDLALRAFAPTAARAQRVVQPAVLPVVATLVQHATPPTTTTTTAPTTTTTTTSPPPTSTTASTTTATPPTTTPPTTTPPTTTTTTAPPPTTTSTTSTTGTTATTEPPGPATTTTAVAAPPGEVLGSTVAAPPAPRSLPRTGGDPLALGSVGSGAVLLGWALRPRRRRARS